MSDLPFLSQGDPRPRSAGMFNELIASARKSKNTDLQTPPAKDLWLGPQDTIRVYNDTGSPLTGRFPIVGLVEPIFLPDVDTAAEHCFLQTPCFSIEYPCSDTYRGRFAVVQGPLQTDRVGHAILSGKFISLVDDAVSPGDSVDIDEASRADDDSLSVSGSGVAKCLWSGTGTDLPDGTKWGLMRFGGGGGGADIVFFVIVDPNCAEQTATASVTAIACSASSVSVGDTIDLIDEMGCHIVGAEESLVGRAGCATKIAGGPYGCEWAIMSLCPDAFTC